MSSRIKKRRKKKLKKRSMVTPQFPPITCPMWILGKRIPQPGFGFVDIVALIYHPKTEEIVAYGLDIGGTEWQFVFGKWDGQCTLFYDQEECI